MDALKFFKERMRMCNYYSRCLECPRAIEEMSDEELEDFVNTVEQWSKEHHPKTRLQDFMEKYPNMKCRDSGIPWACCSYLGYCESCDEAKSDCIVCWNMPVEEDE